MTTVYQDYYKAYDNGTMDLNNVSFLAMLIDESYQPLDTHKLDDVDGVIISVPFVIVNNDIVTLTMGEIIDKATNTIKDYMVEYPDEIYYTPALKAKAGERETLEEPFNEGRFIVLFNPELNILCFCEPINEHLINREE